MNDNTFSYLIPRLLLELNVANHNGAFDLSYIINGVVENNIQEQCHTIVQSFHDQYLIPTYKIRCSSNMLLFDITLQMFCDKFQYVYGFWKIMGQEGNFYEYVN